MGWSRKCLLTSLPYTNYSFLWLLFFGGRGAYRDGPYCLLRLCLSDQWRQFLLNWLSIEPKRRGWQLLKGNCCGELLTVHVNPLTVLVCTIDTLRSLSAMTRNGFLYLLPDPVGSSRSKGYCEIWVLILGRRRWFRMLFFCILIVHSEFCSRKWPWHVSTAGIHLCISAIQKGN